MTNYYCFNFREKGFSEICDLIEEAKDAKICHLELENSDQDTRIGQLELENSDQDTKIGQLEVENSDKDAKIRQLAEEESELSRSLLEKIPECPVNIKLYFTLSDKFP